jgi:hypothetical protein
MGIRIGGRLRRLDFDRAGAEEDDRGEREDSGEGRGTVEGAEFGLHY